VTPVPGAWIPRLRSTGETRVRLFCFPYAGGAAAVFREWAPALPPTVEVCPIQLPGRGSRFREPPFRRLADLVPAALEALRACFDRPFALFGHSMGALVAYELTRELRRRGAPLPVLLIVSGHEAPHRQPPLPPMAHLPDPELIEEVRRRYDGIPEEVLAEPELLELLVPVLRADMTVLESHGHVAEAPLPCALSCFAGEGDRHLSREDLEGWREHTLGSFRLRVFPGGHFFIDDSRNAVLASIAEDLGPWLAPG
jgi:medium-chain acyl-[acyl-carrier-protein] hydrolase